MITESLKKLHLDILYPTIMVGTKKSNGSGVIVYQKKEKGKFKVYVITAYHCVFGSLESKKVKVTYFKYKNWSKIIEEISKDATIVAYNKNYDLALLKFYSEKSLSYAKLNKESSDIFIFDKVYACGCGLGYCPIVTSGYISNINDYANEKNRWTVTSLITDGNSGCGIYLEKNRKLIGIACEVGETDKHVEVNHICFILPIHLIRKFLKKHIKI